MQMVLTGSWKGEIPVSLETVICLTWLIKWFYQIVPPFLASTCLLFPNLIQSMQNVKNNREGVGKVGSGRGCKAITQENVDQISFKNYLATCNLFFFFFLE